MKTKFSLALLLVVLVAACGSPINQDARPLATTLPSPTSPAVPATTGSASTASPAPIDTTSPPLADSTSPVAADSSPATGKKAPRYSFDSPLGATASKYTTLAEATAAFRGPQLVLASTLGNVDGFQASRTEDGAGVVIAASYSHVGGAGRAYVLYRSNDPGAMLPDSAIIDNFNFLKGTPGGNPKFSVELVELASSQHAVVSDDGSYVTGEFFQGGLRVLISADSEAHVLLVGALHELAAGLPK